MAFTELCMRYGEINQMLFTEQIFSSFFAVLSGLTAGIVSSSLFVTLIVLVYLPEKHSIPLTMYSSCWDFARLLLFLTVMCAMCFFMMKRTVKKMKINESLKLGEDG